MLATNEAGQLQPVVLRNLSPRHGELRFEPPPYDRLATYYAPGPVVDFDRDGRVDLFLPSWFEQVPNRLYRNVTKGGHWLTVRVTGSGKNANPMGIGAIVWAYSAGHVGEPKHLLARSDIAVGTGYASGEEALAHLGLGEATRCDIRITWEKQRIDGMNVEADRFLTLSTAP
jgi:enediyne biosynthesis protein E4